MSPNKRNLMVGVVVIAGLLILAWMILKFANRAATFVFTKGTPVHVAADHAEGLSEGSAIYYRGVNVGRVLSMTLAEDQRVRIEAIINPGQPVPFNVAGFIRTGNLLSASASIFLELPADQPPGRFIQPGDTIAATIPRGSAIIPSEFTDLARELREQQLIRHLDQTVITFREQAERAGKLMDSMNGLVSDEKMRTDLRTAVGNIRTATEQANRIAANLEKFSGDLNGMSQQASATITDVRGAVGDVRKTIASTNGHMDTLARNMNDRIDQIGKLLGQFQSLAGKVEKGEGTAGKLFTDPKLYDSMAVTAQELKLLVGDLRRLAQQWEQEGLSLKMK